MILDMNLRKRISWRIVSLLLLPITSYSQPIGCDIQAIRNAFTAQGHYVELQGVQGQPCSMYFINTLSQSAANSQAQAQILGANMAVFNNVGENAAVNAAINAAGYGGAIWIGYLRTGTGQATFYALDGSTGNFVPNAGGTVYQNWAGGEPNNNNYNSCIGGCGSPFCSNQYLCQNGEQCVQIYSNGQWNDLPCNASSISIIEVNLCPITNTTPSVTICSNQSANLIATNTILGSAPYQFSWSPTTGVANPAIANTTASPSSSTTYTVTVTDRYGCQGTSTTAVTVNSGGANAGSDASICTGDSYQLNATPGAAAYTWFPTTGLSNPNISNPIATPTSTTIYSLTATAANGCTAFDDIIITVNPSPTANAGNDGAICINGVAFLNGSGAGANGTYLWSPTTALSSSNIPNPSANPSITTTYTLTVTDANGCSNSDDITITVNSLPLANAGNDVSICEGAFANLNAAGGVSYSWSPSTGLNNASIASPVANPSTNTTYVVTVTDANNCSSTDDLLVTVNTLPQVTTSGDVSICVGNSTGISASGALSYSWSPTTGLSADNISNPQASPLSTTTYTVTGTDAVGCSSNAPLTVTVNPLPLANAGTDVAVCPGEITFITATGGTIYVWSPAAGLSDPNVSNPSASPITTTTYSLLVFDDNGCQNTDNITITVSPAPLVNAGNDVNICAGDNIQLTATNGFQSYAWSPITGLDNPTIFNPTVSPANTTTYTLTVTDASNCSGADQITVTVNPLPSINAGNDISICEGGSGNLIASGGVSYSWTPATDLNNPNISSPITTTSVGITYSVTGTDAFGCVNTDDVTVTVNPLPVINAGPDLSTCLGSSISLNASGALSYSWSPSTGLTSVNISNPNANPTVTTTFTVEGTDANGCVNSDDVEVAVLPLPTVNAGSDITLCNGSSVTLNGSSNASTFLWTPNQSIDFPNVLNPNINPTQTSIFTLTVTDINNCTNSDDVMVNVVPTPFVNFSATQVCSGFPTVFTNQCTISSGSLASFAWDFGNSGATSTDFAPVYTFSTDGTFDVSLIVTSELGCSDTFSSAVIVNPLPDINFNSSTTEGCVPLLIDYLNNSSISTGTLDMFQWSFGNGFSSVLNSPTQILYTTPGSYSVSLSATSNLGCISSLSTTDMIVVHPSPAADFISNPPEGDIVFNPSADFTDESEGNPVNWYWNFGDFSSSNEQNPSHTFQDSGSFSVQLVIENQFGCSDTVTKTYVVNPAYTLYVPNAFTPGRDEKNEVFMAKGTGISEFEMVILDRWGNVIFRSKDINEGWDGTIRGDDEENRKQDYYTYQINIRDYRDYPRYHRGTVLLVK